MIATFCRRTGMLLHFQQVTFGIAKRFRLINTKIRQEVMIQSFRLPVQQEVHIFQELTSYKKIRLLMGTHHLLSDAVYEANLFYNDQLLASIICSLCNVTAALFMLLQHASIPNLVGIAKTSLWILFITYFLVMITISSSSVTEASHETAQIVRKLTSKNLNPELKDLLESFMLQLVSQNNTFSAMGYFQVFIMVSTRQTQHWRRKHFTRTRSGHTRSKHTKSCAKPQMKRRADSVFGRRTVTNSELISTTTTVVMNSNDTTVVINSNDTTVVINFNDTTVVINSNDTTVVINFNYTKVVINFNDTTVVINSNDTTVVINFNYTKVVINFNDTTVVVNSNDTTVVINSNDTTVVINSNDTTVVINFSDTPVVVNFNDTTVVTNSNDTT
ncbi:hypothetical protein J6590_081323 [Homalodisca vitripennis]|nr:hypothetical protein J6590_081323 [Homalodisca vitripennis]